MVATKVQPHVALLDAWLEILGLTEYPKQGDPAWRMASNAAKAGLMPNELRAIYHWLMKDPWWQERGVDIAILNKQKSKWQSVGSPGKDDGAAEDRYIQRLKNSQPWRFLGSAGREEEARVRAQYRRDATE